MMQPRLISPEQAKIVANAGGVVGIWTHWADSLLLSSRVSSGTNRAWPGLTGGFFPAFGGEMLRQGFTPKKIAKVGGGNYGRVFGKATTSHV